MSMNTGTERATPRRKQVDGDHARTAQHMLSSGFADYLAARVLLFQGMPLQASYLAALSVEKHLKAIITLRKQRIRKHLNKSLINAVKNFDKRLAAELNADFLTLLQRCYTLRYKDSLPRGFSLVIASNEFLAELDAIIDTLRKPLSFSRSDRPGESTSATPEQLSSDERYRAHNIAITGVSKDEFISARPQWVYEVRATAGRPTMEFLYLAQAQKTDGNLLRPGVVPTDDALTYKLAFTPAEKSNKNEGDSSLHSPRHAYPAILA